ncbi:unnamed protein product [Alternaria alternata]
MTATTFPRHIPSIPYSDPPSRLQTLDIWLPRPLEETSKNANNAIWLVYIHGGAWRDPLIESQSFEPTIKHLVASHSATLDNIAGIASIYNLPLLIRNHLPPTTPEYISEIYKNFIIGAFGEDQAEWQAVSPVSGKYNAQQWPEGKLLVLCHSYEDELVERAQRDVMCVALDREGFNIVMEVGDDEDEVKAEGRRVVNVRDLKGGHDWIWEDGKQIAILAAEAVERLV